MSDLNLPQLEWRPVLGRYVGEAWVAYDADNRYHGGVDWSAEHRGWVGRDFEVFRSLEDAEASIQQCYEEWLAQQASVTLRALRMP